MKAAVVSALLLAVPHGHFAVAAEASPSPRIERCRLHVDTRTADVSLRLECTLRLWGAEQIPLRWLAFEGSQLDRSDLIIRLDGRPARYDWRPLEAARLSSPSGRSASLLVVHAEPAATRETVELEVVGTVRGAVDERGERSVTTVPVPGPPWPTDGAADAFEAELRLPPGLRVIDAFPAELAVQASGEPPRASLPALPSLLEFTTIETSSTSLSATLTRARVTDFVLALTLIAIGIGAWFVVGRPEADR